MSHQSTRVAEDIEQYLREHESKDLLRFITCGNVDDGKSTLIGRLLHDSKGIFEDQLAAVTQASKTSGTTGEDVDLALLVDGLQSEREQGITIDVAYRFFSTERRKFIIADTPGHEQYTRNMATGASNAGLAIILVDARHGVQNQTRRHSFICDLLGIQHLVVAVNKMDLVDYSESRFREIVDEYQELSEKLSASDIRFVPLSALKGDNVVSRSERMDWYRDENGLPGPTLLTTLESVTVEHDQNLRDLRLPVQYVNRPHHEFRGYCGTLAAGVLTPGQRIRVLPSGHISRVARIITFDGDLDAAYPGQAVTVTLDDELDISRGDWIVAEQDQVTMASRFDADIVWMSETLLEPGRAIDIVLGNQSASGQVTDIVYQVDVNRLEQLPAEHLALNSIARCRVALTRDVAVDCYGHSPGTGGFILVDRLTNRTVGAGMVRYIRDANSAAEQPQRQSVEAVDWVGFEIELNALVRRYFPHWQAKDVRDLLK